MKKRNVDFVISYEHWQRELYGCTLLKLELERRGYTVELDHFPIDCSFSPYRRKLAPKVVIYPWLYTNGPVKEACAFGKKPQNIINLQSEQSLSEFTLVWRPKMPRDEAQKGYHVCWGNLTKERMLNAGVEDSHLRVVGNIHLDVDRPEFTGIFPGKEELARKYDLDASKPWVMFFSNFKFARMDEKDLHEYLDWVPQRLKKQAEMRVQENVGECAGTLNLLLEYIRTNPDIILIYRYHPVEMKKEEDVLKELVRHSDRFRCINDGTIQDWIPACDMFLTTDSTSMTDVYMRGKPFGLIETVHHDAAFTSDIYHEAKLIRSVQELQEAVAMRQDYFPLKKEVVRNCIANDNGGRYAFELLADWAEEILHKEPQCFGSLHEEMDLGLAMRLRRCWRQFKEVVFREPIRKHFLAPMYDDSSTNIKRADKWIKKFYGMHTIENHRELLMLEKDYEVRIREVYEKVMKQA